MENYDVVIVGGGISGLMAAYEIKNNSDMSVIVIEKGKHIRQRTCPMKDNTHGCYKCKHCAITSGLSGAGAFSDGKFILGTAYGGWLQDYIGVNTTQKYIDKVYDILKENGCTKEAFHPDDSLKTLCLQHDLHLLQTDLLHLGTDDNYQIMCNFIDKLEDMGCTILTETQVVSVDFTNKTVEYQGEKIHDIISGKNIIISTGRSGNNFVQKSCQQHNVKVIPNPIDIGVRVEMPSSIWKHFSDKIYEPKILYRTKSFQDKTRMFCFNTGSAYVVTENNDGLLTVNGHSFADKSKDSGNCNFAILSTVSFTKPFNEPIEYLNSVSKLANLIGTGDVIVQRFGDLQKHRRTDEHRLSKSTTVPTLKAIPGDLGFALPYRMLTNIIETLEALNKVAPGCTNDDTLLYGMECKNYSARPELNENFECAYNDVYFIGDGAGITRSLSQASAHGLYVADIILSK